ncbi:MAG TPA: efflux RND transporter periplasmic adaptor subunit, partial [Vicinamibacterales bacterium]
TAVLAAQRSRGGWPFQPASMSNAAAPQATATESGPAHDRVPVDTAATRTLDITLERVSRKSLTQAVRAVATIVPDEARISHIHTRVAGWIEHLDVNTTGETVREGQVLAHIFSQELLSSQTEYLAARKNTAASGITSAVVDSGRTRLAVLGMTAAEIDAIEQSGEPRRLIAVIAPRSGVVVNRGVTAGTSVDPSTTLLTIADLSRVWVLAEVPEASIPFVRVGAMAQLDFPASGRPPFAARVDFAYPTLSERTRTMRVRLSAANVAGALKPGLYGTAVFETAGHDVLTVPRDAVVDTGLQQHVFVAVEDRFEPRPVTVGVQLADRVEIRDGLVEGEQVVASGVFLLDSESRLRATGGASGHNHSPSSPSPRTPAQDPHAGHRGMSSPPAQVKE